MPFVIFGAAFVDFRFSALGVIAAVSLDFHTSCIISGTPYCASMGPLCEIVSGAVFDIALSQMAPDVVVRRINVITSLEVSQFSRYL